MVMVAMMVMAMVVVVRCHGDLAKHSMAHRVIVLGLGHGPLKRQRAEPAQQLAFNLSPTVILAVEGAALLALLAAYRGSVPLLGVGTSLALRANKSGDDVAVFTCCWLSISFHILFTLLADDSCADFPTFLLVLGATVGAFDDGKGVAAIFTELLPLRKFFEWVSCVASCACEQR